MALEKGLLRWLRHLLRQVVRHHAISILMIGGPAISPVRYSPGRRKRECGWRISPWRVCTSASFHRPQPTACYPRLSTTTAAVLSAAALPPTITNSRQLAMFSGCRVIAVQYRLAPEHTFPAAHDDAEQGAMIIHRHNAEQLGVDASRITLAGDSAGGHLALVTALRLKAAGTWQPAQLILIYPMLDATASMASYASNGEDYIITRDTL